MTCGWAAEDASVGSDILDVRLVPAVAACWGITVFGLCCGWIAALAAAALLTMMGGLAWSARDRAAVAGALLLGAGFAVSVGIRGFAMSTHPLTRAHDGAHIRVSAVLDDDPRRVGTADRVRVRASLVWVRPNGKPAERASRTMVDTVTGGSVVIMAPATGWAALLPGQRVEFSGSKAAPRGRGLTVATLYAKDPPRLVGQPPWWQRSAAVVRGRFAAAANRGLSGAAAGLLPALVIGDVSRESADVIADFKDSGLNHLTAVSGGNLSILMASLGFVARRAACDKRLHIVVAVLAIVGFVIVARPSPSVLRAAVMGGIGVFATAVGRARQTLPVLCGTVLLLIGWAPALTLDIGFMLSVAATAGLIVLSPGMERRLVGRGIRGWFAEPVAVAIAAFVATTPIVVAISGRVSLISIPANLLVHLVAPAIMVVGLVAAVAAVLWAPAGAVVAWVLAVPLWWMLLVAHWGARTPGGSLPMPTGFVGAALAVAILVVIAAVPKWCRGPNSKSASGNSGRMASWIGLSLVKAEDESATEK